jgi:excisionase family DNA binding protein
MRQKSNDLQVLHEKFGLSTTCNTGDAATYLGLSKPYLEKLRCSGGGPRFAKLGRRVVYRVSDLDTWLENHIKISTSAAGRSR